MGIVRSGVCRCLLLVVFIGLSACSSRGLVKAGIDIDKAQAPTKLVVVTPDFVIHELNLGKSQERVVQWENNAATAFERSVINLSDKENKFAVVGMAELSQAERDTFIQHRALFATMVPQLLQIKSGAVAVWAKEAKKFNYTLGPGLAGFKESHGADAVVFVVGKDTIRSGSRIALDMINSFLPGAQSLEAQQAYLVAGIADLATGDLLLFDYDAAKRKQLSNEKDVQKMADEVLTDYKRFIKQNSWF